MLTMATSIYDDAAKPDQKHLEDVDIETAEVDKADLFVAASRVKNTGTVVLSTGATVYIPTPTADPRDPLNLPMWHKVLIIMIISLCKSHRTNASSPKG